MANFVRKLVSRKKLRFKQDGYNLDLAYITNRIIAMGAPSESVEGMYRNPMKQVVSFLEGRHHDHYWVYNLCSERSYDHSYFQDRVSRHPFDDHNVPPFQLLEIICREIRIWIDADPDNVAAIHCKAGKGRTGVVVCCLLMDSRETGDADESLLFYGHTRTQDGKGVTIPSQRRYVRYYAAMLASAREKYGRDQDYENMRKENQLLSRRFTGRTRYLERLRILGCTAKQLLAATEVQIMILSHHTDGRAFSTGWITLPSDEMKAQDVVELDFREMDAVILTDDAKLMVQTRASSRERGKDLFHFWFNVNFLFLNAISTADHQDIIFLFEKSELDGPHKDKKHKRFPEHFACELTLTAQTQKQSSSDGVVIEDRRSLGTQLLVEALSPVDVGETVDGAAGTSMLSFGEDEERCDLTGDISETDDSNALTNVSSAADSL
eukprot:Clim_evm8s19 gene=Clim_evmTU8s19